MVSILETVALVLEKTKRVFVDASLYERRREGFSAYYSNPF